MQRADQTSTAQDGSRSQRKAWVKPAMQKIRAGDAEIGTRMVRDGTFTTS
jgi:hypothetical protein